MTVVVQSPSHIRLCYFMDCSTPGLPVPHHLLKFAQVHVHCISDAIQPSHPLTPSSPSALNLSQHQGLFPWASPNMAIRKRQKHGDNRASLVAQTVKNPPAMWETGFDPWVGKIPWRGTWQPTPLFLPGESPWTEEPGGLQSMGLSRVIPNE